MRGWPYAGPRARTETLSGVRRILVAADGGPACLPPHDAQAAPLPAALPGLAPADIDDLSRQWRFDVLAAAFPQRGDVTVLKRVAWYGSAIAGIFAPDDSPGPSRRNAQQCGALFNVAVALFDTCIDTNDRAAPGLIEALEPRRLGARLRQPLAARLNSVDPRCDAVVALFDRVLEFAGLRFGGEPQVLDRLEALLTRMYLSEVKSGEERQAAKVLPVSFICAMADGSLDPARLQVHARFGALLALLDDCQDLNDDLMRGRANHFVCTHDARALRATHYLAKAIWFTLVDTATRGARIRRRLESELQALLAAAGALEAPRRFALLWLLQDLLGVH
jgi:hypothetical protein